MYQVLKTISDLLSGKASIFVILTVTNVREAIINAIPKAMKSAVSAGIGLFIAFIGLYNAEIVVGGGGTVVSLGDIMHGPAALALIGLVITSVLMIKKVRGAMLIGIIVTAILGLFFQHEVVQEDGSTVMQPLTAFTGVVDKVPSIDKIFWKFEWNHVFSKDMIIVVFTFLLIDTFDTIGTVIGWPMPSLPYSALSLEPAPLPLMWRVHLVLQKVAVPV